MFGLNLKEATLCLLLVAALLKRQWKDYNNDASTYSGGSPPNSTTRGNEQGAAKPKTHHANWNHAIEDTKTGQLSADSFPIHAPVVLQNLTSKAAYNGHVGRIKNYSQSAVLVAVHGVFFDAPPRKLWVKPHHILALQDHTSGRSVDMGRVKVKASSSRGDFPLDVVLEGDDSKWWISKPGTLYQGKGHEYLDFELGSPSVVRVLGISIPPLPVGPLSVREFSVEGFTGQQWISLTPRLRTLDRAGIQEVALKLIEAERIRLNCFASAAPMDSLGLFQVILA